MNDSEERDREVQKLRDAEWLEIEYSRVFNDEELAALQKGFISKDMDTKWSFYFKDGDLILERSWIQTPIFKLVITNKQVSKAYTKFHDLIISKEFIKESIDGAFYWLFDYYNV